MKPTDTKSLLILLMLCATFNFSSTLAFFSDDGMFGSLKDLLKEAQDFLVDDMLPIISKGIVAVQKVEEFVDATIGEDCSFECPGSQVPRSKQGHVTSSNGCGSLDVLFDDSEESLIHVEKEFTDCCNVHDVCYDTCNADKDDCDLAFKRCLYKICKSKKKDFLDSKTCNLKAKVFYLTVIGVGCKSYLDAQRNSCACVYDDSNKKFRNEL